MLLSCAGITLLLYRLPEEVLGIPLQKVDLLSELRPSEDETLTDDNLNPIRGQSVSNSTDTEKEEITKRDALYEDLRRADAVTRPSPEEQSTEDPTEAVKNQTAENTQPKVYFEDFSSSHLGLLNTYKALASRKATQNPLRIAFMGDSFIEADIFTLDVRRLLQKRYGGGGPGWMPFTSEVAGYRQGVSHTFSGWKDHFIVRQTSDQYPLTGHYYTSEGNNATLHYQVAKGYTPWNCATLYYTASQEVQVEVSDSDTIKRVTLPPSSRLKSYPIEQIRGDVTLSFTNLSGAKFYGLALDKGRSSGGVIVDNYSHRGSSGIHLAQIESSLGSEFAGLRPYNMIVLQYGLNVASPKTKDYSGYTKQMKKVIEHLQKLYPRADIVIMGVSDRAKKRDGAMHTMPAIYALRKAQRQLAHDTGVVFWDTFQAMGGEDAMVRYTQEGLAAKDYTHMSFKGGKRLAEVFFNSFLFEEQYYQRLNP